MSEGTVADMSERRGPTRVRNGAPAKRNRDEEPGVVTTHPKWWTDLDTEAVDTARLLAADAVQKVGNGHPGTAMSLAPLAYLLYQRDHAP